jgi:membrane associated rhomboid family serine protease
MFEKTVEGYNKLSDNKKNNLKSKFFDDDFEQYKNKKKTTQKRLETIAKFGVVGVMITLNTLMYIPQLFGSISLVEFFALYDIQSDNFRIYQIFTHMFLHGGFIHLLLNMIVLWSFGKILEKIWSAKKFLILYILSGIGAAILSLLFSVVYDYTMMVGASGAISGLIGAMYVLHPESKIMLFFFIPIKIKTAVMWFAGISLILALTNFNFGIGNAAHLGGLVTGYLITKYWKEKGNLYTTFI